MNIKFKNKNSIEIIISKIIRIGVLLSAIFMVTGFIISLCVNSTFDTSLYTRNFNLEEIIYGFKTLNAPSFMFTGIFILILTPIVRVISTIVLFAINKDKIYIIITTSVLLILIICFIIGILSINNVSNFL